MSDRPTPDTKTRFARGLLLAIPFLYFIIAIAIIIIWGIK